MSLSSISISILLYTVDAACLLCDRLSLNNPMPIRPDCVVDDATGLTCAQIVFDDTKKCDIHRHLYEDVCCSDSDNSSCFTVPPVAANKGEIGNEPTCHICKTPELPGNPDHIFTTGYIGTYSCSEYYDLGKSGLIPGFMCGPLQEYSQRPCGCGIYNPKCIKNSAKCFLPGDESTSTKRTYIASSFFLVVFCIGLGSSLVYVFCFNKTDRKRKMKDMKNGGGGIV